MLLDIASFWIQAWRIRQHVVITYPAFFIGLAVALAYYISAALVFPRQLSEWIDLDEHYAAHKRQQRKAGRGSLVGSDLVIRFPRAALCTR